MNFCFYRNDRHVKHAWDTDNKNLSKKEDKGTNRFTIPSLDFSSLSESSKNNKFQDENRSDDQLNKKDKRFYLVLEILF